MGKVIRALSMVLFAIVMAGCSIAARDVVVVDWANWLADGSQTSWRLQPGTYRLQMTASGDGASVEWVGTNCPRASESRNVAMSCELNQPGQLIVGNPTVLGLGTSASVTVHLTRLAE